MQKQVTLIRIYWIFQEWAVKISAIFHAKTIIAHKINYEYSP